MMVNCYGRHNHKCHTYHHILFFLDFHLALSVMKHMRGAAEYNEDFDGPDSDFYIPQMQLVEAY